MRELLDLLNILTTPVVVMLSQMFAHVHIHQIVYIKYMQFYINDNAIKLSPPPKKSTQVIFKVSFKKFFLPKTTS